MVLFVKVINCSFSLIFCSPSKPNMQKPCSVDVWYIVFGNGRGFARFVNIRDGGGATPLHLAARQRQPDCVHVLLDHGALACASTGGYR